MLEYLLNKELEKIWKETVVKYYPGIFLEGLRKATKISVGTVSVLAEIQTRYHPECKSEVLSLEPTSVSFLFHECILFNKTYVHVFHAHRHHIAVSVFLSINSSK